MKRNLRIRHKGYDERYKSWHTLGRHMILYIHEGVGSIISKEKSYPITPGALCFVGANKFYYTLPDRSMPYERSKVFLSDEELSLVLSLFGDAPCEKSSLSSDGILYAQLSEDEAARVSALFEELGAYAGEPCYENALVVSACIRLLVTLTENAGEIAYKGEGMVQKAVEYINRHMEEELSINAICAAIHVSKYYFCRKFKEHTGLTVMSYILKTRITSAKNMLENEKATVGEVSERCGFSSQSYFGRVFKEHEGLTPMQYKKKLLGN